MILGIDEVGRGPWAGPLVVGAVVLGSQKIEGLTDSKKLSKKRRDELNIIIRESAAGCGLGWVSAHEIDEIGLSEALRVATRRAVEQISAPYHEIIIDGTINFLSGTTKGQYVTTLKKADLLIPSVSAASIIAKVARDNYMTEQDKVYPGYKFSSHVGYGTSTHRAAIEKNGVTPLHRLSFAPLKKYADTNVTSGVKKNIFTATRSRINGASTKSIGDVAEATAAEYLLQRSHEIIARNWKTRYCEIDIVSKKDGVMYFTEVKYRRQSNQGGGLVAVTPKKLLQMRFAAEFYAHMHKLRDTDMILSAVSLAGSPPIVESYIERI